MPDDLQLVRLNEGHYLNFFDCGEESMDRWLCNQALDDQEAGLSATHVWAQPDGMVFAYITLLHALVDESSGPFWRMLKPRGYRRNDAHCVLIGKIALDQSLRGRGLGEDLFADAFVLAIDAVQIMGGVFIVIDPMAGRPRLRTMYEGYGFRTIDGTDRMYMSVKDFQNGVPLEG